MAALVAPYRLGLTIPSGNWWEDGSVEAAWQAVNVASLIDSYTDLSGKGNTLTEPGSGSVMWDASNGWGNNFAGNVFLATGIAPANDQSWTMIVRCIKSGANTYRGVCGGKAVADGRFWIGYPWPVNTLFGNGGYVATAPPPAPLGSDVVLAVAGGEGYVNGVPQGLSIPGWAAAATPIIIGGFYSTATVAQNSWDGYVKAMALYSSVLDPGKIATISAAIAAL